MQIEHVYRCLRCGKEVTVVNVRSLLVSSQFGEKIVDGLTGNESLCHYCDERKEQVGRLELIGMNLKSKTC